MHNRFISCQCLTALSLSPGSIIANLLGNVENHPMLKADKTLVRMMVDCLAKARKGALYFGAKWRPSAALQSLASLAVSDSNKKVLLSEGVAKVMLSVLKDTKSPPDAKAELYAVKVGDRGPAHPAGVVVCLSRGSCGLSPVRLGPRRAGL